MAQYGNPVPTDDAAQDAPPSQESWFTFATSQDREDPERESTALSPGRSYGRPAVDE